MKAQILLFAVRDENNASSTLIMPAKDNTALCASREKRRQRQIKSKGLAFQPNSGICEKIRKTFGSGEKINGLQGQLKSVNVFTSLVWNWQV